MKYWDGYKFVVAEDFTIQTAILGYVVETRHAILTPDGKLTARQGYPWDGNSGPFPDTKSSIEASCGHDILCDFVNEGLLPFFLQPLIDQEYYIICVRKGMWWRLARSLMLAIRWYMTGKGAKRYTRPVHEA